MKAIAIKAGLTVAGIFVVAACSTAQPPHHKSLATARPVVAATPSCQAQLAGWGPAGVAALRPVERDMQLMSVAAMSGYLGVVQGAADRLGNASRKALKVSPPACIPGFRADWKTAMHDFIAVSASTDLGTPSGIEAATVQVAAGAAALRRATHDLKRFER